MSNGKKNWYVVDGWIPAQHAVKESGYEGHEALIVLNCNDTDVRCWLDFYFEDKDPIENIEVIIPAKRVRCFRMDKKRRSVAWIWADCTSTPCACAAKKRWSSSSGEWTSHNPTARTSG